jgi:hypothetical protein
MIKYGDMGTIVDADISFTMPGLCFAKDPSGS